ncbi:MAG: P-loop ATPase, Sll1717 family, partial [Dolichospermum sp.]
QVLSDHEIWREFEAIAEWLERFLPTVSEQRLPSNLASVKDMILQELEFSAGTAESQSNLLETFVETDLTTRALDPRTTLVIGRKGMGKTAIFRRLSEDQRQTSFVILSPSGVFKQNRPWILNPESFQSIEMELNKQKKNWRDFWLLQTCLACYLSLSDEKPMPDEMISNFIRDNFNSSLSTLEFIKHFKSLLGYPDISLLARDWITRFDQAATDNLLLLFDGLDTGFGNTEEDRKRRTYSIEGLLSLVMDLSGELQFLKFKLFLRDDIWRKLRFDNKSHFFGRSVTLSWGNKSDFLQVIIKQALQSNSFKELLRSADNGRLFEFDFLGRLFGFDLLNELQVLEIWNILVGERMRGGKSAFTRNWVWNRIADGSNNHSPRTLLQLFAEAKDWEMREQAKNPDKKTIIRPRALNASLEMVSKQALDALIKEEFPELETLI